MLGRKAQLDISLQACLAIRHVQSVYPIMNIADLRLVLYAKLHLAP